MRWNANAGSLGAAERTMTPHGEPAPTRFTSVLLVFGLGLLACFTGCPATDGSASVEAAVPCDTPERWFMDADGDGYGNPSHTQFACELPDGFVDDATDCDDATATTHPGAVDACDGVDNDCEGKDEHCSLDPWDSLDGVLLGEPGDGLGCPMEPTGTGAVWVGACSLYTLGVGEHGRIYLWEGPVEGEQEIATGAARIISGVAEDQPYAQSPFPWGEGGVVYSSDVGATALTADSDEPVLTVQCGWLAGVGDLVGDGAADDLLCATYATDQEYSPGVGAVVHGTRRGDVDAFGEGDAIIDLGEDWLLNVEVDIADDLDGDGIDELLVFEDAPNPLRLFRGPLSGSYMLEQADATFEVVAYAQSHHNLSVGDIDGDGLPELVVNPGYIPSYGTRSVLVYRATTDVQGTIATDAALARVEPLSVGIDPEFESLAAGGDFQGDGHGDLIMDSLVGGWGNVEGLWVVSGPVSGVVSEAESDPHILLDRDIFSMEVTDLDADGLADLLLAETDNLHASWGGPHSRIDVISGSSLLLLLP